MCLQPYPGAPYYEGRVFSSGIPYSVVAADILGVNLTDYAVGGATSGAAPGILRVPASYSNVSSPNTLEVPSTVEQVLFRRRSNLVWSLTCQAGSITQLIMQHAIACLYTTQLFAVLCFSCSF